jgi:NADPH:quinone reductase-like Zn-dependent oxidoreductase
MARAIDARGIKPVIDRTYTFMDARQAYEDLPKGNHFGKLIIDVAS